MKRCAATLSMVLLSSLALAGNRDVQVVKVHFDASVIQIMNLGLETINLSGWRAQSSDEVSGCLITEADGLDGRILAPGASLFLHLNNDAPARANAMNASDLGGSIAAFNTSRFSFTLFAPSDEGEVDFSDGSLVADHLQWAHGGVPTSSKATCSDVAVAGGTWPDTEAWIATSPASVVLYLNDLSGSELHSPTSYGVHTCIADMQNSGYLDFFDVLIFLDAFSNKLPRADINLDGEHDFFDAVEYLGLFSNDCN